jgi:hypothetical protein
MPVPVPSSLLPRGEMKFSYEGADHIHKVNPLYETDYVIFCVGNLTEEKVPAYLYILNFQSALEQGEYVENVI